MNQRKALFLDRDGVVNLDHGYVHSKDQFDFIDGIFDLVRSARAAGYLVLVVTNQAGIGRGYFTEEDFNVLTDWMCGEFERQKAPIDKVYCSPYHPTAGVGIYRQDHHTRKPRPGMIFKAQEEFNLSLQESILVGDRPTDVWAGIAAGVGTNIIFTPLSHSELIGANHIVVHALKDIVSFLK